ncbi:MAG: glycosyltransferase family A protein [Streptococcus sp.]
MVDNGLRIVAVSAILMLRVPNISVYHIENHGVGSARNFGLSKVRGEFIYFVDSDDYLVGNLFADFKISLLDLDLAFLLQFFEEDLTEKHQNEKSLPFKGNYDKDGFIKTLKTFLRICFTIWNKIYRREFSITFLSSMS